MIYLPFFPLKLVAFPGEELNLHIFEPRYRQLLADAEQNGVTFGICTYINQLTGYGTEVRLEKIYKRYEDGRLDIKTRCLSAFQIQTFDNPGMGFSNPNFRQSHAGEIVCRRRNRILEK